jgi:hypothetical protein
MELPVLSNSFQIKPSLDNLPQESRVKQLIQKVIGETLLSKLKEELKLMIPVEFYFKTKPTQLRMQKLGPKR